MENNFNNSFYRIHTITALLSAYRFVEGDLYEDEYYTIERLSSLLKVPIGVIRNDLISLVNFKENSVSLMFPFIEDGEFMENTPENKKAIEKGVYDKEPIVISGMENDGIGVVLSASELDILSKFLEGNGYNMEQKSKTLLIKNSARPLSEEDSKKMVKIENAIRGKKAIQFMYAKARAGVEARKHVIYPLKLVYNNSMDLYYVLTERKGKIVSYRLDRISHIEKTNEVLEKPDASVLDGIEKNWNMDSKESAVHVKIKIQDFGNVIEKVKLDLGVKAEGHLYKEGDDYIYEDDIIGINSFRSWLFSYGASMVVLEPEDLRKRVIDSTKRRLKKYGIDCGDVEDY